MDIFDAKIMCKRCNVQMKPRVIEKEGAQLRSVQCEKCKEKIIHPADLNCLNKFNDLKGKNFSVKLRVVGNSHAISIPKEIVDFMNEQHRLMREQHKEMRKRMNDMVRLAFEDFDRISLNFNDFDEEVERNHKLDKEGRR